MWICANCSEQVEDEFEVCWNCQSERPAKPARISERAENVPANSKAQRSGVNSSVSESSEAQSLVKRYWDSYLVARVIVGVGKFIKIVGVIFAVLILLGTLLISNQASSGSGRDDSQFGLAFGLIGFLTGCLVGVLFYIWGVIISAVGEILKAVLDSAVNTSPFLTDKHRAKIMSLD